MVRKRVDIETVCTTCGLFFTMHNVIERIKEVDSGYHISALRCPNCNQKTLDFDLMMTSAPHSPEEVVKYRKRKMKHD